MKTTILKIAGEPADGDIALVACTDPRLGGMSNAMYTVNGKKERAELVNGEPVKVTEPADTPAIIAEKLAERINNPKGEFCAGQFSARANGDTLIISSSDIVSHLSFIAQFQGSGSGTFTEL